MDSEIQNALETDRVIDITTIGRKTGQERRIEIWFHYVDGEVYITGLPGTRSWYANMKANPSFTFHLKESITADIPATARPVTDEDERREVLNKILHNIDRVSQLDKWVAQSPLVHVALKLYD